jgi:hypothetical protein
MLYGSLVTTILMALLSLFILPLAKAAPILTDLSAIIASAPANTSFHTTTAFLDIMSRLSASGIDVHSDVDLAKLSTSNSFLSSSTLTNHIISAAAERGKKKSKKMPLCPEPLKNGNYPITWDIVVYNPKCWKRLLTFWKGCDAICGHGNGNKKRGGGSD